MLSRQLVIDAALELAAHEGFEALGLRAVSTKLGVTPMALYRHVGNADALLREAVSAIVVQMPVIDPGLPWSEACRSWAHEARALLASYPGTAHYILQRWFEVVPMLVQTESLLATALAHGKRGFDAVAAVNAILMYVLMRVEAERTVRRAGAVRRSLRRVRAHPEQFPALHEHLVHYELARFDEHFDYGLETLLNGMEQGRKHVAARR